MPVRKDVSGRRLMELELLLPGTPEEVWRVMATGPGVSAWFVPTQVQEHEGGEIKFNLGAGMESTGVVTHWKPPHKFVYEEREWMPGAPPLATEIIVETQGGGQCRVRMVHSLFTSSEQWDNQLEGFEIGWQGFFRVLRTYMAHFRGMPSASVQVTGGATGTPAEAWARFKGRIGLEGSSPGTNWHTPAGTPQLAGAVEHLGDSETFLRLEEPAPGAASIGAYSWGGNVMVQANMYFYGERAGAIAAHECAAWEAWMNQHFPAIKKTEEASCQ